MVATLARRSARHQPLSWFLSLLRDQKPASQLIRATAREQWKLLVVSVGSNLVMAFSEGATLAVIYMAVDWLNRPDARAATLPTPLTQLPAPLLFVSLMAIALLLQMAQSMASYINMISSDAFAARCQSRITSRLHNQILSFSFSCASGYRIGDLSDHISLGPMAVNLQIALVNEIIVGGLMAVMYLLILLKLSPYLMVVALLLGALILLIQKQLVPKIQHIAERVTDSSLQVSNRLYEHIQGLRLLHTSGQLDRASEELRVPLQATEVLLRKRSALIRFIEPASRLMPILAFAVIASFSVLVFQKRDAGVLPNLVTFMVALQRLNARLSGIASATNALSDNSSRMQRLNNILEPEGKQFRRKGGIPFQHLEREIRFDRVSLRYNHDTPAALEEIDFVLPKGQTLALVGSSGAGKSSIADLLVGLYSPSSGRILIDAIELESLDLSTWQERLGVVSQDTFLFNASLAENIAFGCPWATAADVSDAAARAQAAGFIAELPEGYDTRVGERGYRLSGGQRQRISLARALLRQPELLILDEATSALDSESERLVQEAIESFEGQQTVLVIAHRLSTIKNADQILVLNKGRIVERGGHHDLIRSGGRYSRLWLQQSQQTPERSAPALQA